MFINFFSTAHQHKSHKSGNFHQYHADFSNNMQCLTSLWGKPQWILLMCLLPGFPVNIMPVLLMHVLSHTIDVAAR